MMKRLIIPAETERIDEVLEFLNGELEERGCPMKALMQISIASEEIFVNIANYAYAPGAGEAEITIEIEEEPLCAIIRFIDEGKAFNPLDKPDPDITLDVEEREVGGLGIYMVKKSMDEVLYARENGRNILEIRKRL